jgi:Spy/CpxP family protein refolding chaperone
MIASARQRARRALIRLSLSDSQAEDVRRLLRDERRQWEVTQRLLRECRCQLSEAMAVPRPDSSEVLELTVQERLLRERERLLSTQMEATLAKLLRPEQARRVRALPPAALGDVLRRICA